MQISRHLLLTCAVAACLTPTLVHAADNEAQIRARQALEEKMKELNTQPPPAAVPTTPAPAPAAPKAPAKPAPPVVTVTPKGATVEKQPQASAPVSVSMPSNDAATNQKLQEALHQRIQQAPAEPAAPVATTQTPATPAKPVKPAVAPAPAKTTSAKPAPAPASTAVYAPLPESNPNAVRPTLPEQPTPAPAMSQNEPVSPIMSLPALQGPATGLSAAKEQKLNELLNQYRADQITPQQYHEQRAKILAEP